MADCDWQSTVTCMSASLHPKSLLPYAKQTSRAVAATVVAAQGRKVNVVLDTEVIFGIDIVTTDEKIHVQMEKQYVSRASSC